MYIKWRDDIRRLSKIDFLRMPESDLLALCRKVLPPSFFIEEEDIEEDIAGGGEEEASDSDDGLWLRGHELTIVQVCMSMSKFFGARIWARLGTGGFYFFLE